MKYQVWDCKIVVPADIELPNGFDNPPRRAAVEAVRAAGIPILGCFSGWAGRLTEVEHDIIDEEQERARG